MKIVLTGIGGFVGESIKSELLKHNHEVIGIEKKEINLNDGVRYLNLDISSHDFVNKSTDLINDCDAIIHTAAIIDKDLFNKSIGYSNCIGTQQVLHLSKLLSCHKFIFISSIQVIGKPLEIPVTEDHLTYPQTAYHASKLYGENLTMLIKEQNISPLIFRITAPIGVNMPKERILPVFICNCIKNKDIILYGKGLRKQNYIDVRDIALIIEKSLNFKNIEGIFNIGSDKSISNYELANICKSILKSKSEIIFNGLEDPEEKNEWIISIEKAGKYLGYKPVYLLEDTILDIKKKYENSTFK